MLLWHIDFAISNLLELFIHHFALRQYKKSFKYPDEGLVATSEELSDMSQDNKTIAGFFIVPNPPFFTSLNLQSHQNKAAGTDAPAAFVYLGLMIKVYYFCFPSTFCVSCAMSLAKDKSPKAVSSGKNIWNSLVKSTCPSPVFKATSSK